MTSWRPSICAATSTMPGRQPRSRVMGAKGAVEIIFRKDIADPEKIAAHTKMYEDRFLSPFVAAERGYIDEVIMPHSTRRRLARGLKMLATKIWPIPGRNTTIFHSERVKVGKAKQNQEEVIARRRSVSSFLYGEAANALLSLHKRRVFMSSLERLSAYQPYALAALRIVAALAVYRAWYDEAFCFPSAARWRARCRL